LYLTCTISELVRIFAQNFSTNYPSRLAIKRCKNVAKKFKFLPRVQQRHRQPTEHRRTDNAISGT